MMETTFIAALTRSLHQHGEKTALTFVRDSLPGEGIAFGRLNRYVNCFAHSLLEMGVAKGDRVILAMDKCPALLLAHLAIMKIGAISVPLNPGFKKPEMEYFLDDSGAGLVISDAERSKLIHALNLDVENMVMDTSVSLDVLPFFAGDQEGEPDAEVSAEDPALIIYTSGTTGKPKGAVLSHANLLNDAETINQVWEISATDTICHALPLFHVHGLCFAFHTAMLAGSHVVMLDKFETGSVITALSRKQGELACTVFMAVPAMYTRLIAAVKDEGLDCDHIRLWTSGSAPLMKSTFKSIERVFGRQPVEREGMSETGMNFTNPIKGEKKPGSIGIPLPGVEVRIVDPHTLQDVAAGDIGEIWLKGKSITTGYWQNPKVTADSFCQGWFKTGDLGRVDPQGYFYLTDRMKNIIISGGENISPKEIEAVINQMERVDVAVVVGIPDQRWGEKVVAAVVLKKNADLTAEQVMDICRENLHDWKCPREITFVKEIPRNVMGKVLVDKVRELFQ
ncbi:MAG: AMP-binding protein [Deltaproteobacteria bacterium]